jgi:hypothetical protein
MKKLVFSLLSVMVFAFAQAQVSNSVDGANAGNATVAKGDGGADYFVGWSDEAEVFSFRVGSQNSGSLGYFTLGMDFGFGDVSLYNYYLGYGIKKRYYMNDAFLIQAAVWPYAGLSSVTVDNESEYDFLYGISAQIEAGIKIFTTKKGNDFYLTIGYDMAAPEFETENVVENGTWQLGVTMRL